MTFIKAMDFIHQEHPAKNVKTWALNTNERQESCQKLLVVIQGTSRKF
jgi:hypothetical protein